MTQKIKLLDQDKTTLDMEKETMFQKRKEKRNLSIWNQPKPQDKKEEKLL